MARRLAMVESQIQPDHHTRGGRQRREKEPEKSARLSLPRGRTRLRGRTRRVARGSTCRGRCTRLCLRSPNAMFPAGCREALLASLQKSARIVGAATVRSGLAVFAVSRRRRRCSVRRWRRAYSSRTHSATGAFHGCCGEGTFFRRLRGLKPSSFAICTSAAESRQRRAASVHSLSIPSFFSAIDEALTEVKPKKARLSRVDGQGVPPPMHPRHTQLPYPVSRREPRPSSASSSGSWLLRAAQLARSIQCRD
jgi:hypothetical protein